MKSIQVTLAAAALLLSGTAFAAQPAAGEAPYFNAPVASTSASSVQRQDVMADAARHMPAAGEMNTQAAPAAASTVTRAQVREATREAIAHGYRPASGESA